MTTILPNKDPGEAVTVLFDFSPETTAVTSPVTTAVLELEARTDSNPTAVVTGAAQISGTNPAQVLQRVMGGLDGNDYGLRCSATAANGDTLVCAARLPVRNATP